MDIFNSIYWPGVLLAALANYIFGWVYYSPFMFGKCWASATGASLQERPNTLTLILAYLNSLLYSVGIFLALGMGQVKSPVESVQFACMLVIFFILPTLISSKLWNKRPLYYLIGAFVYHLVSASIIALVITAIR